MEKMKEILPLIKKELILCLVVPILTAILFGISMNHFISYLYLVLMGLFCAFLYGSVVIFIKLKRNKIILNEDAGSASKPMSAGYRAFVVVVAIFLPVAGLCVNNGFTGWENEGIFGNFASIWFYVIAILNGLIMLVEIRGVDNRGGESNDSGNICGSNTSGSEINSAPGAKGDIDVSGALPLLLFYLKIIGFTYITYFTIIFLPLMPMGFLGLALYGLGILIFVPGTVFVVELLQIRRDFKNLKGKFERGLIAAIVLGVITLPVILTVNFYMDKANLNRAMTYLSVDLSADAGGMPGVDLGRLETTLRHMNNLQEAGLNGWGFDRWQGLFNNGANTPIISRYYQFVALDNKVLSPDTAGKMRQIFFGISNLQPLNSDPNLSSDMRLLSADTRSVFDEKSGIYKTWIDLEIRNESERSLAEYRTEFSLPDGCFIGDYYLDVGSERKEGILADKRAALITYLNIIRTPKDPGILYYKSDDAVALRVYPFSHYEVRRTGFLVWHSQDEIITIDDWEISLAAPKSLAEPLDMPGISFIPAAWKNDLPTLEREARYYFVLDASAGSPYEEHLKKAEAFINAADIKNPKILAASYQVGSARGGGVTGGVKGGVTGGVKREGGYNLPLAMELIFRDAGEGCFPIIIAVSDNIYKAPEFQRNNIAKRFPESEYYYNLGYDLSLTPYSFSENKKFSLVSTPILSRALNYKGLAVADNDKSEVVIIDNGANISGYANDENRNNANRSEAYYSDEYRNAFILYGKSSAYNNDNSAQIALVRDSFRQRILTRYTAFTVLETREQERQLLELQAKFLNSDTTGGDFADAPAVMMNEPGLLLMCTIMVLTCVIIRKNRRNKAC